MKKYFLFRRANIKDLKNILKLNFDLFKKEYKEYDKSLNLSWTYSGGRRYFKDRIVKKNGFVEIAEVKGRLIGYICGGISERKFYRRKLKYAELENMLVSREFRGQGLGVKLVKDFIDWCKRKKINRIAVTASAKNKKTINFYRKIGFNDYDLILEMAIK